MTDFGDVDETAKELAAAHGRIRARHWPAEEEKLSLSAATRFIAGRLELEEAAKAVRTSEAALTAAAMERGIPKRRVAKLAGVSRVSLDDWLTPREK